MAAVRNLETVLVPLSTLKPYKKNPRRGDIEAIRLSLRKNGQYRPIVVRRKGREILAGNHTFHAAAAEGWTEMWATLVTCDDDTAKRIVLVDNRTNDLAEYDNPLLVELLGELPSLEGSGWTQDAYDELLHKTIPPPIGEVPPLPDKAKSAPGDLYQLGDHRLLCGDATVATDVERLMAGESAALMATDPPYGVSVDHRWREGTGLNRKGSSRADIKGDERDDWTEAWALTDAPVAYVWHGAVHAAIVWESLTKAGFEVRQQIIWVKPTAPISRCAYHWRHEPCWYAIRKGKTASWKGGRSQNTVWEAASPLHIYGQPDGDKVRTAHPTQKPLALFERPIENHTKRGDIVYEPFAGSGTQIIAAETLGRRCYAIELDPRYVDVIVARWEQHTGLKGELVGDG